MTAIGEGSRIGTYRIVRKIGEGGMGAVFEAVHVSIERHVALKILNAEHAVRKDVVGRFFNEARMANLIEHPGIVQAEDFGFTNDGHAFIVMEFLRGEALSKRLRKSGLPCAEAVHLARTIASILVAAHDKNIVHRDLKPDNVMLIPDLERPGSERLKLLDFGIAKLLESEPNGYVKTQTDLLMGTPAYMSPEQCQGASHVDTKSDVYSLGVMLYEMLAGRLPFVAEDSGSLIGMHLFKDAPPLHTVAPYVPEPVATLVDQLLNKDKQQRPTMRQLYSQLQRLEEGDVPLPTVAGGTWLSSFLRTVAPGRAGNSTLGFSNGQLGRRSVATPKLIPLLFGSLAALLALTGAGYVGTTLRPSAPPPSMTVAASPSELPRSAPTLALLDESERPDRVRALQDVGEMRGEDKNLLGNSPLVLEPPAPTSKVVSVQVDKPREPAPLAFRPVPLKSKFAPAASLAKHDVTPLRPTTAEIRNVKPPLDHKALLEK